MENHSDVAMFMVAIIPILIVVVLVAFFAVLGHVLVSNAYHRSCDLLERRRGAHRARMPGSLRR